MAISLVISGIFIGNGKLHHIYKGHHLKDEQGKLACPILRIYRCPLCGATEDTAHTLGYCPLNKQKYCTRIWPGRISAWRRLNH
uniref:Nanos-type domain-containing protein n=1 Tax=Pyxicephalus adspersus TaxID=30357 RepID=A0AAV3A8F3_PYXAD|nr:TPA: hypothetical protein GDO54_007969 [Pyxicephalus adspersus]